MTRLLVFEGPKASIRFDLLRAAMIAGGDGKGDRSPGVIRREARILDLLDEISQPLNGDPEARRLRDGEQTMTVTKEDMDLIVSYAEKTPWTPRAARPAVDLWDWLEKAESR